jgi:hypothetical protein
VVEAKKALIPNWDCVENRLVEIESCLQNAEGLSAVLKTTRREAYQNLNASKNGMFFLSLDSCFYIVPVKVPSNPGPVYIKRSRLLLASVNPSDCAPKSTAVSPKLTAYPMFTLQASGRV